MRFGSCKLCGKYKYLKESATCINCLNDKFDWMVVELHGLHSPREVVTRKGLSKREAEGIAADSSMKRAVREDKFER